ncbi:MAG: transcription-repair coupling factor [Polyangiaceae bacterium]
MNEIADVSDPLAPVLPPEGVVARRVSDVVLAARAPRGRRLDVSGLRGSAASYLVAALATDADRPVVFVTSDVDAARKAAKDVAFWLARATDPGEGDSEESGEGRVLVLGGSDTSPYADVNPDRRSAMARLATLAHLAEGRPFDVLVVSTNALVRKTVPRDVLAKETRKIEIETEIDREALLAGLRDTGYVRAPVVEDPGSFAVRGSLLDVWPQSEEYPVRVELYGDMVVSIKEFDPFEQRVRKVDGREVSHAIVHLPPAREAVLTQENVRRARERVNAVTDAIDWPTIKARALVEDVVSGRAFFGADGFLPAYYEALDDLFAFVPASALVVVDDPADVANAARSEIGRLTEEAAAKVGSPAFPASEFVLSEDDVVRRWTAHDLVLLHRTAVAGGGEEGLARFASVPEGDSLDVAANDHADLTRAVKAARGTRGKTASLTPLVRRVRHWRDHGLRVFVTARAETQAERITTLLGHQGVSCRAMLGATARSRIGAPSDVDVEVLTGPLSSGLVLPSEGFVFVTEEEVFGSRAQRQKAKAPSNASRAFLEDLRSLSVGDFVVHVDHGIGRYHGLVHKDVGGMVVDLIVVEYASGDRLYLPVYRLNQIQKYSGGDGAQPKMDRLGGSTFAKTKSRVRGAVRKMADELLRLYAERKAQPGSALAPRDDDYRAFEATFPFDETADQAKAIEDVNTDLETARPMDRLVCGDVGFGKTEVAIRAAYRMAMAGRQVALLCPTTVLAQQHFRTIEGRLKDFPVRVRCLSRFQTKKEHDETLRGLKDGTVEVVVGTHRLLSKDVHFADLGLLIVDEEQRFGVAHKERIKQIRAQVDVLTLTATPIPRTLQMAVTGLRDLSLITTPPVDRRAVRTLVTRWDDSVIREAVERELARGGQVFYVYNRVEGIYERAQRLANLVPRARIAVGHGQMTKSSAKRGRAAMSVPGEGATDGSEAGTAAEAETSALERTMLDFVEGRHDVLVATAIVESGLDIPRANTIIIDRADMFGLAQLYQLRGRVGRSKERAYCYLVVPPADALSDDARARIEALERHTELGSGFQIASLDLELRGAGDLLGGEQSGNVASVGFDLFCQLLDEAVHELRGDPVVHEVDTELSFDVPAMLPEDYVGDIGVRLSLYKRLASATDESVVADIAEEMEDRFGPPPEDARRLVKLMALKTELRKLRVLGCEANDRVVTLHLREDTPLDAAKITELVRKPRSPFKLTPDMRLSRRFEPGGNGLVNAESLLADLAGCLRSDA